MAQITGLDDWILPETFSLETLTLQVAISFLNDIESLRLIDKPNQRLKQTRNARKAASIAFIIG